MNECISIIIPAYNAADYLENCLNSVICQTYQNIEIILVDDGSIDGTDTIADRFQAQYPDKFKVIHTKNQGVTKARFEGIIASRGEWIGFVDADDEAELDMFERLYNNAIEYRADISHCGHKTIVNNGERIHEFYNTGKLKKYNNEDGLRELLDGDFEPSLWNKLFRRNMVVELLNDKKIDTSIKYYEDLLMNYYLFKMSECSVFEDFCGYHYLARTDSATRREFREEKVLDPVKVYRQILEDAPEEYKAIAKKNYLTSCVHAYAAFSERTGYEKHSAELKKILKDNRDAWCLLRHNDRIKLRFLMISPQLYNCFYRVYERTLQNKQYE